MKCSPFVSFCLTFVNLKNCDFVSICEFFQDIMRRTIVMNWVLECCPNFEILVDEVNKAT